MRNTSSQFYKKLLGGKGELIIENYLTKRGYTVLEKNYTTKVGEADLIAISGKLLVFIEVKTRNSFEFGQPAEAVGLTKRRRYEKLAQYYLLVHPEYREKFIRFDVAEVFGLNGERINYIENAFICE